MYQQQRGLTLIEVLIALAIVAIGLTAVIKTATQSIQGTAHLQEKTHALWIAEAFLNQVKTGVLKLPDAPEHLSRDIERFGECWSLILKQERTANLHIYKLSIAVGKNLELAETSPVITLETYAYRQE